MDLPDFWKKMTEISQQNMALWQQMAQSNATIWAQMWEPWRPMMEAIQKLGPTIAQGWSNQLSQSYMQSLNQRTLGVFQDWDKKVLAQLQEMATANFMASYQKLMAQSSQLMAETQSKDPNILMDYWQTMLTEYLKDMEAIAKETKKINPQHVLEVSSKMATGQWDANVQKYAERFWDSLKVKLQYGPEYYVNPDEVKVAQTPKETVWQKGRWKLYHYKPAEGTTPQGLPVLLVYALINRYYIDDLVPGLSLVEYFTKQGLDVYVCDWGDPTYEDRLITLDQFIEEGIGGMVQYICQKHNVPQVSVLGHCMGGVLSTIYTALHQDKVARLVTLTAPVTARKGGVVAAWSYLSPIDPVVDTFGNVPAKLIRYTFIAMKPYYEVIRWHRYYTNLDKVDGKALEIGNAVDKWVNDNVDVPGEFFRKFFKELYLKDALIHGSLDISGRKVVLSNITCPLINIYGEDDWIVTPDSASVLNELVASKHNVNRKIFGQHLGVLFDPRNRVVWDEMSQFFRGSL